MVSNLQFYAGSVLFAFIVGIVIGVLISHRRG